MHGFSHQYSIKRRNATKPIVSGESVKVVLILFAQYECFFLMWFQFHGIPHHMRNGQVSPSVPHSTGKCNKTYFMGLTWEIGTRTFPVVCLLNFSHEIPIIWYTSWDYHIGNAWVSSWISIPSRQVRQLAYFIIHKSSNFWKQSAYCKCFRRTIITNSKLSLILKFSFQSTFKYVSQLSKL